MDKNKKKEDDERIKKQIGENARKVLEIIKKNQEKNNNERDER